MSKKHEELRDEEMVETTAEEYFEEPEMDIPTDGVVEEPKKKRNFFQWLGDKVEEVDWKKVGKAAIGVVAVGGLSFLAGVKLTRHKEEEGSDEEVTPQLPDYDYGNTETDTWNDYSDEDSELTSDDVITDEES